MPANVSSRHSGWHFDPANARLDIHFRGTRVGHITATSIAAIVAMTSSSTYTGTGTGNVFIATNGNIALGGAPAFATTQGQGLIKMGGTTQAGIAPVGAIATSGGVFASDTVVRKIIADGTASNVET